jgi:hypothetical protein
MGTLYLLHFSPKYKHAGHYLGYCDEASPLRRLKQHTAGRGANLTAYASAAGCLLRLVASCPGTRADERRRKRTHHRSRYCPICSKARGVKCRRLAPA